MNEQRRPLRIFPKNWFRTEEFSPPAGGEPREEGFSRPAHASTLLDGVRQALLSKTPPNVALVPDQHIYFTARTWKNRPSLRRTIDRISAKIHRVLPDGSVIASWPSKAEYEETKDQIAEYRRKTTKTADLDYIDSIKGLDYKDKLGRSLLAALEEQRAGDERVGLIEVVFYPQYSPPEINKIVDAIRSALEPRGLTFQKLITGVGRFSSTWRGPLTLAEEIAKRAESVALVEQAGELKPAAGVASGDSRRRLVVAVPPQAPEVGILDTGVHAGHPLLAGVVLTGDPVVDHIDAHPNGGHGTFVAGVIAYGEDPVSQIVDDRITARALVHPKKVALSGTPGGINLDSYQELAAAIQSLRSGTSDRPR